MRPHRASTGDPNELHTTWLTRRYDSSVTTQIAVRLDDAEVAALDAEVAQGRAANRSDALRRTIAQLQREQRYRGEEAVLLEIARRGEPLYPDLDGILDLPHPQMD